MKAVVYEEYGSPDILELREVETPTPAAGQVRVRVEATTVTLVDCEFRAGNPVVARLYTGLTRPKRTVLGTEFAGQVEAIGPGVTRFRVGDRIFGASDEGFGTHAEYVCLSEQGAVTTLPDAMSMAQGAGMSNGALTALPFLRDHANVRPGDEVLIIGASGSIGTVAVQLAKELGAHVTGVCSTANVELVKSLRADRVVDYTAQDFTRGDQRYDVVFDTVGKSSFASSKRVLKPSGAYLTTVLTAGALFMTLWTKLLGGKRAIFAPTGLRSAADKAADLEYLKGLVEAGRLRVVIDSRYPLSEIAKAHRYVGSGRKKGNLIIDIEHRAA
ncbi:MAG: NAD(P)-dependent alcohol dehydrogenase [Myxococcota bacterium]